MDESTLDSESIFDLGPVKKPKSKITFDKETLDTESILSEHSKPKKKNTQVESVSPRESQKQVEEYEDNAMSPEIQGKTTEIIYNKMISDPNCKDINVLIDFPSKAFLSAQLAFMKDLIREQMMEFDTTNSGLVEIMSALLDNMHATASAIKDIKETNAIIINKLTSLEGKIADLEFKSIQMDKGGRNNLEYELKEQIKTQEVKSVVKDEVEDIINNIKVCIPAAYKEVIHPEHIKDAAIHLTESKGAFISWLESFEMPHAKNVDKTYKNFREQSKYRESQGAWIKIFTILGKHLIQLQDIKKESREKKLDKNKTKEKGKIRTSKGKSIQPEPIPRTHDPKEYIKTLIEILDKIKLDKNKKKEDEEQSQRKPKLTSRDIPEDDDDLFRRMSLY